MHHTVTLSFFLYPHQRLMYNWGFNVTATLKACLSRTPYILLTVWHCVQSTFRFFFFFFSGNKFKLNSLDL